MSNNTTGPGTGHDSRSTTEQARDAAQDAAQRARAEAEQLGHQAKDYARSEADRQKSAAADEVHGVADALRSSARSLDEQHQPMLASYVKQAAEGLDSLSGSLSASSLDDMVRGVEGFARRQPGLFLGGAVATGFMLARFLKASSERSHYDGGYSGSYGGGYEEPRYPVPAREAYPPSSPYQEPAEYQGPEQRTPVEPAGLGQAHPPGSPDPFAGRTTTGSTTTDTTSGGPARPEPATGVTGGPRPFGEPTHKPNDPDLKPKGGV